MGRILLIMLVIVAIVLLWRAFGPGSAARTSRGAAGPIGPDDDPDFLWRLDKRRYDEERERRHREDGGGGGSAGG